MHMRRTSHGTLRTRARLSLFGWFAALGRHCTTIFPTASLAFCNISKAFCSDQAGTSRIIRMKCESTNLQLAGMFRSAAPSCDQKRHIPYFFWQYQPDPLPGRRAADADCARAKGPSHTTQLAVGIAVHPLEVIRPSAFSILLLKLLLVLLDLRTVVLPGAGVGQASRSRNTHPQQQPQRDNTQHVVALLSLLRCGAR